MLPSHSLPPTGSEQLDQWLKEARNYLSIVAARCSNCLHHRCRECLSLQARKLCFSLDAICDGRDIYMNGSDLNRLEKLVMDLFAVRTTRRGDDIPIPGMTGRNKSDFLKDMEARGLLISELRVTGASGHTSRYYSLPECFARNKETRQQHTHTNDTTQQGTVASAPQDRHRRLRHSGHPRRIAVAHAI